MVRARARPPRNSLRGGPGKLAPNGRAGAVRVRLGFELVLGLALGLVLGLELGLELGLVLGLELGLVLGLELGLVLAEAWC